MFSESVAQKPIMPVSAGKKNGQNWPAFGCPAIERRRLREDRPEAAGLAIRPPRAAASPSAMSSGALMFSSQRMRIDALVDDQHVDAPEEQEADELRAA